MYSIDGVPPVPSEILKTGSIRVISTSACKDYMSSVNNATVENNQICVEDELRVIGACTVS